MEGRAGSLGRGGREKEVDGNVITENGMCFRREENTPSLKALPLLLASHATSFLYSTSAVILVSHYTLARSLHILALYVLSLTPSEHRFPFR